MEHAPSIHRPFSWRGAVLALGLLLAITLAVLGARALVDSLFGTRPAAATGHVPPGHAVALAPRSATPVLVLNGNGFAGAAGTASNRLLAHGYTNVAATNAPVTTYAQSLVLYRPGWEQAARRLAKDAHVKLVAPLDGSLPRRDSHYPLALIVGR